MTDHDKDDCYCCCNYSSHVTAPHKLLYYLFEKLIYEQQVTAFITSLFGRQKSVNCDTAVLQMVISP